MVSYIPENENEFTYLKWQIKFIVIIWRRERSYFQISLKNKIHFALFPNND